MPLGLAGGPHQAVAAGKRSNEGRSPATQLQSSTVAGQGVEHVQELVAVALHRAEATPAGDRATRQRGASPCAPAQPARVTGPIQKSPVPRGSGISFKGAARLEVGVFVKAPQLLHLALAFPDGGQASGHACGQNGGPAFEQAEDGLGDLVRMRRAARQKIITSTSTRA